MTESATHLRTSPECWVYFIACVGAKAIKIGMARNVKKRLAALQGACPYPLHVMATTPGAREQEFEYHKRFAQLHLHGEWFNYEQPIQDEIERLNYERYVRPTLEDDEHAWNLRTIPVQFGLAVFS